MDHLGQNAHAAIGQGADSRSRKCVPRMQHQEFQRLTKEKDLTGREVRAGTTEYYSRSLSSLSRGGHILLLAL
jgi:hypothetical protein